METDADTDCDGLGLELTELEGEADELGESEIEDEGDALDEGERLIEDEGLCELDALEDRDKDGESDAEELADSDTEDDGVGDGDADGEDAPETIPTRATFVTPAAVGVDDGAIFNQIESNVALEVVNVCVVSNSVVPAPVMVAVSVDTPASESTVNV